MAVAIVNHNTRDYLDVCLESVRVAGSAQTVVVDNASSDDSVAMVSTRYPEVTVHANRTNTGYGSAANQAIASCTAPYVLLLNSDTRLEPGVLETLSRYLDRHPRAAIVGPRLVYPTGALQESTFHFPSPLYIFLEESNLGPLLRHIPACRDRYLRTWTHTHNRIVPWVLGGAMAIRREAFDAVGGFDESFFMYCEETDLCYRLEAAGWETHFTAATTIVHVGGASTVARADDMQRQFYASKLKLYRRHNKGIHMTLSIAIVKGAMVAKLIRDGVRARLVHDEVTRARLQANIAVWRRVLLET